MQEYEQTQTINAPAGPVFAWLSDVDNLPHYLPPVKESAVAGPSSSDTPGQRIRLRVEIPDRYETESEGYFSVDESSRSMQWGAEMSRDYSGWLAVEENGEAQSVVTVHLSFGPRSVEDEIQEGSSQDRNPLAEGITSTLESIRRQIEEGSGKEEPPST